ncbi:hypothetical protein CHU92_14235 [Flavobacterium cyanobacteriorum]|uniref:DUF1543 domain-containing protein n=1 Tax=Flavobacterium cyanobacteriorum TaxID=2022802 RepID=A0A255YSR2_9FLAO|nr:DUF1543 domain-containing protein [Flavobacterium cyanobacteriorum]OYQ32243.1 hypothetical protein CHU92_14235 [Flavobacterium cyanobacteriorum]
MDTDFKLYMILLGCKPKGRFTEQHDIFFGIGTSPEALKEEMYAFWPDAGTLHIDSWREVTTVEGCTIKVVPRKSMRPGGDKLFFINLGGYRPGDFEEYHYKMIMVAPTMAEAIKKSKASAFYKHFGFRGAESHIDDKYGIDVDDVYPVEDMLAPHFREKYALELAAAQNPREDILHIGYLKIGPV